MRIVSVYNDRAAGIVKAMLEADYDEHVKAHERVQKWDKARTAYQALAVKEAEAAKLFAEIGRAIAYKRALARVGLTREDVSHQIYGAQIGSIENYKKTRPAKVCRNRACDVLSVGGAGRVYPDSAKARHQPMERETCSGCGEPLETVQVPINFSDLHRNYAHHMMGVETNDGRRVWFDEPVPPT